MKRVSLGVVVLLIGAMPSAALADHPGEISGLTPAIERVLGEDTTQAPSGVLKVPLDDGAVLRTHGPDVSPGAADPLAVAGPSDRFLAGSAERAPLCATDYALQIIYARNPSAPDRFATVAPQLRSVVKRSNHVLNEEAIASGGGGGDYKVTCSGSDIDVRSFTTSATSFGQVVDAARAAGFTSSARDYVIFLDSNVSGYCGVGSLYFSDGPSLSNPHNTNGGYSVVYKGCWEGTTFMHEVGHNRGAVQPAAPDSTGSGAHCNEGHDVMCYAPDGGDKNQSMVYPCSTLTRFDCNFDTYFDAAPEAGEWLSNHWNLGRQGQNFMVISPAGPPPNQAPTADYSADCTGLGCSFTDESTDPDGSIESRSWNFGDGGSSTVANPQHTYAAAGSYTVVLTVTDEDGATDSHSQLVDVSGSAADTAPPETEITRGPAKRIRPGYANFQFTGSDAVTPTAELAYFCSVDHGGFGPCTSPARFSGLGYGRHSLRVSAVDAAGNADQSPAEYTWTRRRR